MPTGVSYDCIWFPTRVAVYERDGWKCVLCAKGPGEPRHPSGLSLDHLKPRVKGGRSIPKNLVTLCVHCNRKKGTMRATKALTDIGKRPVDMVRARLLARDLRPARTVRKRGTRPCLDFP